MILSFARRRDCTAIRWSISQRFLLGMGPPCAYVGFILHLCLYTLPQHLTRTTSFDLSPCSISPVNESFMLRWSQKKNLPPSELELGFTFVGIFFFLSLDLGCSWHISLFLWASWEWIFECRVAAFCWSLVNMFSIFFSYGLASVVYTYRDFTAVRGYGGLSYNQRPSL